MAELNVNPTRVELRKIKNKLKTAQKGHHLLKEKTNELIRHFHINVKENKEIRANVEHKLKVIFSEFDDSKARLSFKEIKLLFAMPNVTFDTIFSQENLMNIIVPKIKVEEHQLDINMPYSPLSSTFLMDKTVGDFYQIFPDIIKLAELEKKTILLAEEIKKCNRRVNALENIVLPKYERAIARIQLKLNEDELNTTARLMKIKKQINK